MTELDEEARRNLRYAGARLMLDLLEAGEAIRIIESLMMTGIWRDSFVDLLDCQPIMRDVAGPFSACLDELDARAANFTEAALFAVDYHTHQIAGGRIDPCDGLYFLIGRDLRDFDADNAHDRLILDAVNMETLHKLDLECRLLGDHCVEDWPSAEVGVAALAAHRERIVDAARSWQAWRKRDGARGS